MPPTAKEIKYDRQLRLWSANGQSALESAHLLLINATATGTEILKNLVLPGNHPPVPYALQGHSHGHAPFPSRFVSFWVSGKCLLLGNGAFTILDGKKVTGEDAGVNFFLEEESIGSSRGEEAYKYISELNPDVRGHFITKVTCSANLS